MTDSPAPDHHTAMLVEKSGEEPGLVVSVTPPGYRLLVNGVLKDLPATVYPGDTIALANPMWVEQFTTGDTPWQRLRNWWRRK